MRERPILFSGPMIRAILSEEKTQTRRIIKPQPEYLQPDGTIKRLEELPIESQTIAIRARLPRNCPYGQPGDRLWVRETWREGPSGALYRATDDNGTPAVRWRPSIHMPRRYSRLTLEIVSIRVERLQDISEADAQSEGVCVRPGQTSRPIGSKGSYTPYTHRTAFESLWDEISSKRGYGWDINPWVWVIAFKRAG